MTAIFVLDVEEFRPLIEAAGLRQSVKRRRFGPYVELSSDGPIEIDRRESGVRHAVWYSALAGVRAGRVVQFDKEALKVVPE
jgi:hypothetical protein